MIANFHGFRAVTPLQGVKQLIPGGPLAGWMAIKQLGSNGGGFFNVNSAHPFENPTQLSNFLELYLTVLLAFALAVAFGVLVKDKRQGRLVLWIMVIIWIAGSLFASFAETNGNPRLTAAGANQSITADQGGGNMEGKEVRAGVSSSAIWGASVTLTSNGSVNSMHDSWTPAGSLVPFAGMLTGEVTPGGVGVGLDGHARERPVRGVHRRAHDRSNTGVPRQEAPEPRDEADRAVPDRGACGAARLHGRVDVRRFRAAHDDLELRDARIQRDPLCLRLGGEQQRVGVRGHHRRQRSGWTRRSGSPCSSGGSS